MRTNEPNMNITNQINAGLNDVRKSLIDLSCDSSAIGSMNSEALAKHCLEEIIFMVRDFKEGKNQPWSDRKHAIDEEFS